MDGLSSLVLPSQKVMFSQHRFVYCFVCSHFVFLECSEYSFFCSHLEVSIHIFFSSLILPVSPLNSIQFMCCFIGCILFCRLPLSDDPALAMAFSVARRTAVVPLLLVNGTYRKTVRPFLDSAILQHQLQRLNDHGSLKGVLLLLLPLYFNMSP